MAVFPGDEFARGPEDYAPLPEGLQVFSRIEGLVGQERALLAVPADERSQEQRDLLRAIGDELDRVFEKLRQRAQRVGAPHAGEAAEDRAPGQSA